MYFSPNDASVVINVYGQNKARKKSPSIPLEQMIIRLNVGGTNFETTRKTLSDCANIDWSLQSYTNASSSPMYFLDHDPEVFAKTLRVLRGYPSYEHINDAQVLHQLVSLGHKFADTEIPAWAKSRVLTQDMHTLEPEQTLLFGESHTLLSRATVDRLVETRLLRQFDYADCRVLGVREGWIDSKWVPTWEYKAAATKLKFLIYFCGEISESLHLKKEILQ